jgi:hypothetical protein
LSYDDRKKSELQDELRERDLPISGSKQDLIDRLTEADEDDDGEENDENDDERTEGGAERGDQRSAGRRKGPKPLALARMAAQQLEQVSGRRVDGVTGIERTEEGWRVGLDLVESARIPPSTDVLGAYEVIVDEDGDLVRYERIRRYIRAQEGDDQ